MKSEDLTKLIKACQISAQALEYAKQLVKPGKSVTEACDLLDKKVFELGGKPAFPSQISFDHVAAHTCPAFDDKALFDRQVVKIDVGVHVDGWVGDNALTIDLSGRHADLLKASRNALNAAVKLATPGRAVTELGEAIHGEITALGFAPIRNLGGHGVGKYEIHAEPSIPNYANNDKTKLKEGQTIAVEPFASTGEGVVVESGSPTIFSLANKKPVRDPAARKILQMIDAYNGLPFCQRWLARELPPFRVTLALKQMTELDILTAYPPLADRGKGIVSQAEHTVLVKDRPEVLTKTE